MSFNYQDHELVTWGYTIQDIRYIICFTIYAITEALTPSLHSSVLSFVSLFRLPTYFTLFVLKIQIVQRRERIERKDREKGSFSVLIYPSVSQFSTPDSTTIFRLCTIQDNLCKYKFKPVCIYLCI